MILCALSSFHHCPFALTPMSRPLPLSVYSVRPPRFLQEFLVAHPEYASNPFYVFGESYGGHYAPSVAHRVWQGIK